MAQYSNRRWNCRNGKHQEITIFSTTKSSPRIPTGKRRLFYSIICSIKGSRRSILPLQQYALHFLVRLAELCGSCLTPETLRDVAFHINCTLVTTRSSDSMHMDYFDQRSRHNEKGFVNSTDRMRQDDQRQHDERTFHWSPELCDEAHWKNQPIIWNWIAS